MKHSFLKRLTAIVLVVIMVVSMIPAFAIGIGAAEETYTWTRVTSADTLKAGGEFIIGYEATANSGVIIPMANTGGATLTAAGFMYSGAAATSADKSTLDMTTYAQSGAAFIVTIAESTATAGNITIHTGTGYIGNTNTKNNCKLFAEDTTSNGTSFTPTVGANDVFTLKNANASYHTFSYNTSSPRFACYGGTQKNLVIYQRTVIPAGDPECQHTNTETIPAVPATCTETGLTEGKQCADCEVITVEQTAIPAIGHTWGDTECTVCHTAKLIYNKVTEAPADWTGAYLIVYEGGNVAMATQSGSYRLGVSVTIQDNMITAPEGTELVIIEKSGDNWTLRVSDGYLALTSSANALHTSADKTEDGATDWTISMTDGTLQIQSVKYNTRGMRYNSTNPRFACYASGQQAISFYKLDCSHATMVEVENSAVEPDCTTPGKEADMACSVCGHTVVGAEIEALGHADVNPVDGKCDRCDVTYCGNNHAWEDRVDVAGDCLTDRVVTKVCANCGEIGEEIVTPARGHHDENLIILPMRPPTCTTPGLDYGTLCDTCETIILPQAEIPAEGHSYGDDGVCVKPQCCAVADRFAMVTDLSQLQVGDKIIIVAADSAFALGTTQASNNRPHVAYVTTDGFIIPEGTTIQVLTVEVGTQEGTFAFNTGSGYLYAASSGSNHLKTEAELSDNSSWTIEIAADGVATVKAQGTNTRNWLRYNSGNDIFSCYASGQGDIAIYKAIAHGETVPSIKSFGLSLNKGVTVRVSYDIPADWLAANPGAVLVFKDGDTVVGEPIAAVAGKNTYSVNLSPANINAALTVTLQTADGLAVGNPARDVSVAAYMAMVNADDMTAETLGISDEKLASLRALLTAVYTYGQTADGTHTGGLVEAFEGVGDLAPVQNAEIFTSVGATLGEYATVMLNVNAANIPASAKLSVTLWGNEVIKDGIPADSITSDGQLIIQNLWPANFASTITVTFASDGETVATLSFTFNEYLKALAGLDGLSEADLNRIIATYRYGVAAAVFAETA